MVTTGDPGSPITPRWIPLEFGPVSFAGNLPATFLNPELTEGIIIEHLKQTCFCDWEKKMMYFKFLSKGLV